MNDAEMDALSHAARSIQNKTGEQSLWKAVLALPAWYFIAQGEGENAEPLVAKVGGRARLLAFTSEDRAAAFGRHLETHHGGGPRSVLSMDVVDAVEYAQQLFEAGVETIHFNTGDYEFTSGMIALKDRLSRYIA